MLTASTFVGRARELEALSNALDELATAGSGGLFFVTGEPGIGKSRLCEELAARAAARGVTVLVGRCWEAGGAPAYWPWIQILRQLLAPPAGAADVRALGSRLAPLAPLLPELETGAAAAAPAIDPEQARFQVLDAASAIVRAAARQGPLLVLLEDLHAADVSSILLLEFLAGQARQERLLVLGTYREADAARRPAGEPLARVAVRARGLTLTPLGRAEVAVLLGAATGTTPTEATVTAVHGTTEGNPLFVIETTRLLASGDGTGSAAARVPPNLRMAMRARAAELGPRARELLALASVIGRDFSRALLAALARVPATELAAPLAEAGEAALITETAPGQCRFSHILLRETLYQDLADERRSALHLALADALEGAGAAAEVTHHLRASGPAGAARLPAAARRAAEQAFEQAAFDEAAALFAVALEALDPDGGSAARGELLVALGRARLHAGLVREGQQSCLEAAEIARLLGHVDLLAQAALAYGALFVAARVDPTLVTLLEEALAARSGRQDALAARLMGRLAAARQPAPDPQGAIALAKAAIGLARRVGDARDLLETIRAAGSAMVDLAAPEDRLVVNQEHVALAEALGDGPEAFRGHLRLLFDLYHLGDHAGAAAAIEACAALADSLGHPSFRWKVAGLRAMQAAAAGRFDEADRQAALAARFGEEARDGNAAGALALQRLARLALQGRDDELCAAIPEAERIFLRMPMAHAIVRLYGAAYLARAGRALEARRHLERGALDRLIATGDSTMVACFAELAVATEDVQLARAVQERLAPRPERFVNGGIFMLSWDGPMARSMAQLAAVEGRFDDAERLCEEAHALALASGERPIAAWTLYDRAALIVHPARGARVPSEARAAARALLLRAAAEARALEMPGLVARAVGLGDELDRAAGGPLHESETAPRLDRPSSPAFSFSPDGELWTVRCGEARFSLKDSKGVRTLARLVAEPGRELHVLDLVGDGGPTDGDAAEVIDAGDAGALLDREARAAYAGRLEALRETIEEARAHNDPARASRAEAEIEFLAAELGRAVGLGGRERRAGAASERARVNVQRRLRDTIRRIEQLHPALGRHLDWAVRTGAFCSYDPR